LAPFNFKKKELHCAKIQAREIYMKFLMSAALLFSVNAFALCEQEAIQAAKEEAAYILNENVSDMVATLIDSDFNETYGRGEYTIDVEGLTNVLTLYVDMTAFSNSDDTEFTCVVNEIIE
jgi:hypothetical protein